ncbi:hypothetical protein [Oceaniglobus trochenteri]|uniref:hypothetical protein n=1 Tax=Oceaniglobus trochenteri TaxID=2763260 RepID=UPI001CFF715E|nr:hypothetical protein [Oceaniglobus trochenteri]
MDLILILIALGAAMAVALPGGGAPPAPRDMVRPPVADVLPPPRFAPLPEVEDSEPPAALLPPTPAFDAEDQTPTGKFTTAAEVRIILEATRANWVALRDYEGQDLLYFTQLLSWRCGLHQIEYSINDGAPQVLEAEPCHLDTAQPNAITAETTLPYLAFPKGSVQSVGVQLLFDDLSTDTARFERNAILMP